MYKCNVSPEVTHFFFVVVLLTILGEIFVGLYVLSNPPCIMYVNQTDDDAFRAICMQYALHVFRLLFL